MARKDGADESEAMLKVFYYYFKCTDGTIIDSLGVFQLCHSPGYLSKPSSYIYYLDYPLRLD
jgi:hypothetical protein